MVASYFSIYYLVLFLPLSIIGYSLTPKKYRYLTLLACSLIFYFLISSFLIVYLLITSLSIYLIALRINKIDNKNLDRNKNIKIKNFWILLAVIINLGILIVLKYSEFIFLNINSLLSLFKINHNLKIPSFILPIGVSFYTLQSLSYLIDVNRKVILAEKNYFKLLLFISFFPLIIEGPISRYNQLSVTLFNRENIKEKNLKYGLLRILYGLLKKIVIADRLNFFVKTIFVEYSNYSGALSLLGALFYTILLYMEFSGTMDVVIGTGEIFNIKISENFKRPFFSKSISEFWSRWHISLGTFFKDYVYYPLSLSKLSKGIRKKFKGKLSNYTLSLIISIFALLVVWVLNGLWHGSGYTYLFFGLYHFLFISLGNIFEPLIKKIYLFTKINRENKIVIVFRILKTGLFVSLGELIFRAESLKDAFLMLKNIFTNFHILSLINTNYSSLGLDHKDFIILAITLIIIFVVSLLQEKNVKIFDYIEKKPLLVRWSFYYGIIIFIIIFGAYGVGYIPVDPIYANF